MYFNSMVARRFRMWHKTYDLIRSVVSSGRMRISYVILVCDGEKISFNCALLLWRRVPLGVLCRRLVVVVVGMIFRSRRLNEEKYPVGRLRMARCLQLPPSYNCGCGALRCAARECTIFHAISSCRTFGRAARDLVVCCSEQLQRMRLVCYECTLTFGKMRKA